MSVAGPSDAGVILLTGASGFIGGRLAERLMGEGHSVRCLIRASSNTARLQELSRADSPGSLELIVGDLRDPAARRQAVSGVERVIHCAAMVSDWGTIQEIRAINATAAIALADVAADAGARRFIHISTTDVYGNPGVPGIDERFSGSGFANWYSETKREAEAGLRRVSAQTGMELVVMRPATVYGPRSVDVVGELATAVKGRYLPMIGGGRADAGLVYVDNVCDAVGLVLSDQAVVGETFNINDELGVTWKRFLDDLAAGMGVRPPWLALNATLAHALGSGLERGYRQLRRRTGLHAAPLLSRQAVQVLARSQSFSSAKLRRQLGWSPRVGYAEGLAATLTWLTEEFLPGR